MPEKRTIKKARQDKRAGKAPTTQAGEFVREEIDKIRRGEHGARSPQQAIAIGLSKARRAGVDLPPPRKGQAKRGTRKSAYRGRYEIRGTHIDYWDDTGFTADGTFVSDNELRHGGMIFYRER